MINYNRPRFLLSEDPLDMAGGDVDTSFPLLKEKIYKLEIAECKKESSKKDVNMEMLVIKLATTEDALSVDDRTLYKGHKFITRIGITAKDKRTIDDVKRDLGALIQCVYSKEEAKTVKLRQLVDSPEIIIGRIGLVKVGIAPEKDGFPASNTARFMPPADNA